MQEHAFTVTQLQSISECHEFLLLIILRVFVVDSGYVQYKMYVPLKTKKIYTSGNDRYSLLYIHIFITFSGVNEALFYVGQ